MFASLGSFYYFRTASIEGEVLTIYFANNFWLFLIFQEKKYINAYNVTYLTKQNM